MKKNKKKKKNKQSKSLEFQCIDYRKLPGTKKCQHFISNGACKKPDYVMCVEWLRLNENNPGMVQARIKEETEKIKPDIKLVKKKKNQEINTTVLPIKEEPVRAQARIPGSLKNKFGGKTSNRWRPTNCRHSDLKCKHPRSACRSPIFKLNEVYPDDPRYDINTANSIILDLRGEALSIKDTITGAAQQLLRTKPESFSEESCKQLEQLGLEVEMKTSGGKTIFLVPEYTSKKRIELTFEAIRAIVYCLSAFPGSTVDGVISRPGFSGIIPVKENEYTEYTDYSNEDLIRITLTFEGESYYKMAARKRYDAQRKAGNFSDRVKKQSGDPYDTDEQGAKIELATSLAFDLPWDGKFLPFKKWEKWREKNTDVCGIEVKCTDFKDGHLLLGKRIPGNAPCVLVIENGRECVLVGWCFADEGQKEEYWNENLPRPCFFISQSRLRSISELLKLVKLVKKSLNLDSKPSKEFTKKETQKLRKKMVKEEMLKLLQENESQ